MHISELAKACAVSTHALRGRVSEIDQLVSDLQAQRAQVVSHIAWLQAHEHKESARKPFPKTNRKRISP